MKYKLSVTIDEDVVLNLQELLRDDMFRNKSHIVEYALKKMIRENKKDGI